MSYPFRIVPNLSLLLLFWASPGQNRDLRILTHATLQTIAF